MKQVYSISHEEFVEYMDTLAEMILDYEKANGKIHYLVGVPRGGLPVAVYLSHRTGIDLITMDELLAKASSSPRVVICDEIVDSGGTLGRMKKMLKDGGVPLDYVKFASATMKTCTKESPDFCVRVFGKGTWLVFPWESVNAEQIRDCDKE